MKITKYAQSCFLVETKGKRILIDPGYLQWEESLLQKDWVNIDIILVTHKHGDHCHEESVKTIMGNGGCVIYSSKEVAEKYPDLNIKVVRVENVLNFDAIKIEVVKAVHGYMPFLQGGNEIYDNIGFIIDDSENRFYTTSDSISFKNDYKCDILAVPVCNHGLVMGPFEAALFAKETGAKLVIPCHYDNTKFPMSLDKIRNKFEKAGIKYKILEVGKMIEV